MANDELLPWLAEMLGGGTAPAFGPPYEHRHRLPETEEEMAAVPEWPSYTVTRQSPEEQRDEAAAKVLAVFQEHWADGT